MRHRRRFTSLVILSIPLATLFICSRIDFIDILIVGVFMIMLLPTAVVVTLVLMISVMMVALVVIVSYTMVIAS